MLTAERLRELLHHDPETGVFTWRASPRFNVEPGPAGCVKKDDGYVYIKIDGERHRAHNLAWLYVHGEWPPSILDHRDTVRSHNWIDNLRPATRSQNNANCRRYRNNTSGFKGVSWHKKGYWAAYITKDGKRRSLGSFATAEAAHAAYTIAAERLFGEFARVA